MKNRGGATAKSGRRSYALSENGVKFVPMS